MCVHVYTLISDFLVTKIFFVLRTASKDYASIFIYEKIKHWLSPAYEFFPNYSRPCSFVHVVSSDSTQELVLHDSQKYER